MSENKISLSYSNKCSKCNTYMRVKLAICPTCGEQLDSPENDKTEVKNESECKTNFGDDDFLTCPSCRVVNSIEYEKCQTCGYKLFEPAKLKSAHHA